MTRYMMLAIIGAGLAGSMGCVTLFSKVDVVRSEEARKPVSFETPAAAETFNKARKDHDGSVGGAYVGVPFVTLYSRQKTLSEAAQFNDAVGRCDTDQNGTITEAEANIFANLGK
jgi:hypothetical protein